MSESTESESEPGPSQVLFGPKWLIELVHGPEGTRDIPDDRDGWW